MPCSEAAEELAGLVREKEKLRAKAELEAQKRESAKRRIQELGALPSPALLAEFRGASVKAMVKGLEACNEKLKKYSHVNKKAADQFVNFTDQRDQLLKEKQAVDAGAASIQELIDVLDERKDEVRSAFHCFLRLCRVAVRVCPAALFQRLQHQLRLHRICH